MQGQFIGESGEGEVFADRDFGEEFGNCDANASPLSLLNNFICISKSIDHPMLSLKFVSGFEA
jgi:hypothetical protein